MSAADAGTRAGRDDSGRMSTGAGSASLRLLRVLAASGAALMVVVILSSAYLRLSESGLSCADWPACYGSVAHAAKVTATQRGARLAHRFAASAAGAVLVALVAVAAMRRPRLRRQAGIAATGLAIAAALATIGAVSSESTRVAPLPAVTLSNLGGGFALLALLCWLRETATESTSTMRATVPPRLLRTLAALTLIVVIGQVALGGLVSAKYAALACPAFPLCGAATPPAMLVDALDPFVELELDANKIIVRSPGQASLHWAHRVGAHVVLVLGAAIAVVLIRAGSKRLAAAVALLIVIQLALGATSILMGLPLALALAHNLVAAVLLALLVSINARLALAAAPALARRDSATPPGSSERVGIGLR